MGKVFKAFGIIGYGFVGITSFIPLLGALLRLRLGEVFGTLLGILILCIIPTLLYGLGSTMDEVDDLRRKVYGTGDDTQKKQERDGIWICKDCGRSNADHVSICNCGNRRPAAIRVILTEEQRREAAQKREKQDNAIVAAGGWKCTCGRANQAYISTCACGTSKADVTEQ
jgi:hypothetical protein